MQIKTTVRDVASDISEWLLSKRQGIISGGKDVEEREPWDTVKWEYKLEQPLTGNTMEFPQKIKNRTPIQSSNSIWVFNHRKQTH